MLHRRAFSLIELLVVIAIIALLVSILLPALAEARRAARMAVCQSNMRQMSVAHHTYILDFSGYIAALNGRARDKPQDPSVFFPNGTDISRQARETLATLTGKPIGTPDEFRAYSAYEYGMFVVEQYSHLVLIDYLGNAKPLPATACPEDKARLTWRAAPSPSAMNASAYKPQKTRNTNNLTWWPYSSSYQLVAAASAGSEGAVAGAAHSPNVGSYQQYSEHDLYSNKSVFGKQRIDDVVFPALKVILYDSQQRHYGRNDLFFAYPECRQPLALFDGSVAVRQTSLANRGWDPLWPTDMVAATSFDYVPDLGFESPVPAGHSSRIKSGYYRWTRKGLAGIDYGGGEIFPKHK